MKVVLVGFMGSGKSTVGKLLSRKLGVPFVDTDEEIVRKTGMTIPEIFSGPGEGFFRNIESAVLEEILSKEGEAVISTGGGLPAYGKNMEVINRFARSVFLKADFEILWKRIAGDTNRPLVKGGKESLLKLYRERLPFYERAELVVDTGKLKPEETVERIITFLQP